uniref:Uncharacterized protein n=1 Tax=Lactuca sativa TaxID=4236 RepID=A0A9R1V748_LACSA|nr:hypothetical protein LSAT_V11C600329750 [Lactuca sativa]
MRSGLRIGPYVDLLHDERGRSNSNLHAQLFPDIIDERLYGRVVKTGILAVCMDTYFWTYTSRLMRGMFENIEKFRIFKHVNPESMKAHKYIVAGFMLPFKIWILETFPEATRFYVCMLTKLPRMRSWRRKTLLSWPNNHHIVVVPNETELMELFFTRYVNWTLNHEESPPRQQSPPIVASPPRRNKY